MKGPPMRGAGRPGGEKPAGPAFPFLPKDTARAVTRWYRSGLHPGLLAQRLLAADPSQAAPKDRDVYAAVTATGAAMWGAIRILDARARAVGAALGARGLHVADRLVEVCWRLTLGLGGEHPTEIGFTLHRLGVPYLPATGLKGLARATAVEEGWPASEVARLFGDRDRRGAARFLDGYPVPGKGGLVELDVMNPHLPDYYQGKAGPHEWLNPVPLSFLAVPAGVRFRVQVAAGEPQDAVRVRDILLLGLAREGAGAKRAAGYGWMRVVDDGA